MTEPTLDQLAATCVALGLDRKSLTPAEQAVIPSQADLLDVTEIRTAILNGEDPLGQIFITARSAEDRRPQGQTFTPAPIVRSMLSWTQTHPAPVRVVDPGCGSGRYVLAALLTFPHAHGIAADLDPYATLMTRANAVVLGLADRVDVLLADYRSLKLPEITGSTLFIGNPPYVRHHNIEASWKAWLGATAAKMGLKASKLAGLHAHFFLATALYARPGDVGAFITSSEWLDVNYGQLIRDLLVGPLTLSSLHVIDPTLTPFEDATVTGTITCFAVGNPSPEVKINKVKSLHNLADLGSGFSVSRERLAETTRWSLITRVAPKLPEGFVELGELARVHRGTVTGANKVWVVPQGSVELPEDVLFPSVTKACELFAAGVRLTTTDTLKVVIDLPPDLDELPEADRKLVERFLRHARRQGVEKGYVARNRRAWWSVSLASPAPILATYMARRPPAFVRNEALARHINIAHGIYPRDTLCSSDLDRLAAFLRSNVAIASGRTYAGGLTKFEPREMERLAVPSPELLRDGSWYDAGAITEMVGG